MRQYSFLLNVGVISICSHVSTLPCSYNMSQNRGYSLLLLWMLGCSILQVNTWEDLTVHRGYDGYGILIGFPLKSP